MPKPPHVYNRGQILRPPPAPSRSVQTYTVPRVKVPLEVSDRLQAYIEELREKSAKETEKT